MRESSLIAILPDMTLLVGRDGTVLDHVGGRGVHALTLGDDALGKAIDSIWPEAAAVVVKQLVRQAIAQRKTVEARFMLENAQYEVRATARGPARALCTLRIAAERRGSEDSLAATGELPRPQLDRRGFLQRYREALARAALQERPAAVAVIHLDALADIARVVDARLADEVLRTAILRVTDDGAAPQVEWFLGQLNDTSLAVVMETADRDGIESLIEGICSSLRQPVQVGDAAFHLAPYAGVALLGRDATSPKVLLDHARSAASEARRAEAREAHFFTDTLRLRSLSRLDLAREIRAAIDAGGMGLRYVARHDLKTGRAVALVGYMQWTHPLRGEVRPAEFLTVAETTGLAADLSRAAMRRLKQDFVAAVAARNVLGDSGVKISFGPLRHHLLQDSFVGEVAELVADGLLPPDRVEIRIAERSFVALDAAICRALERIGIQIVIDEVGRALSSLDLLARAPIHGIQLDRAWITSLTTDGVAQKVCRAGISAARALGLTPIATGIDDEATRLALLDLGCGQGSGDLYADARAPAANLLGLG